MRMLPHLFAIALIALPFSVVPNGAAADTGRLTDLLRQVPDAALPPGASRLDISYGNGDAVRAIARDGNPAWPAHTWAHEFAALRTASPAQAAALAAGEGEAMSLLYRDWVHSLEVFAPPARMGIHFLYPDSEMRLRGALFSRGMEVATRNGQMVLWEGQDDHASDPARADALNPFGGAEGLASRFIVEGEWALWATGWPQIELMQTGGGMTLADRGDVAQIVSGLSQAVRRYGRLAAVRMSIDLGGAGLEDWGDLGLHGVVIADVVNRREEAALIGFLFAPGTDTEAVASTFRERWGGSMLARWSEAPDLIAMPGARPGFILAIEGDWGEDEAAGNDALAALMRARENGTLAALLAR
jgi:hypothetical protein